MKSTLGLALLATLALAAAASAQGQTFEMKGTWKGVGEAIMDGAPPLHPQDAPNGRPAGPYRLREATWTYQIDGQDGRRFWGTSSSDVSANDRLIGSVSPDGKWIYMAGKAGILDGVIVDKDTIEMCYRHANATSALVNCNVMKRVK